MTAIPNTPVLSAAHATMMRWNILPGGVINPSDNGMYVRYEDHVTALHALSAAASAVAAARPAMPETWHVVAHIKGEPVLSIGYDWVSGRELASEEEHAIVGMAQHLLSFVGYGLPPSDFNPDDAAHQAQPGAVAPAVAAKDTNAFKNFHRSLCDRFGYTHDEIDWHRDQASLIEHIAKMAAPHAQQPGAAYAHDPHITIADLLRIYDEQKGDGCAIAREVERRTIAAARAGAQAMPSDATAADWIQLRSALAMLMLGWAGRRSQDQTLDAADSLLDAATEPGMPLAILRSAPDWRTASAPAAVSAPSDAAKDAARYRWLREQGMLTEGSRHPQSWRCVALLADMGGEHADAAIDAAMLAAAPQVPAQEGGAA